MLDPVDSWTKAIKALAPASATPDGAKALAAAIGKLTNKIQAGPTGSPGILTFNDAIFAAQLSALAPAAGTAWATQMATAWQAAMMASIVTPGTAKFPGWTASTVDVMTLPSAAASIPNISAAFSQLKSGLAEAAAIFQDPEVSQADADKGPEKMGKAFLSATSSLSFLCIGLVLAPPGPPIPLPNPFQAK